MRKWKLGVAAMVLGAVPAVAMAQDSQRTFDCSKMKVVKANPWAIKAGRVACGLLGCDRKTQEWVDVATTATDIIRTRAEAQKAARDNQECLARAAEASLERGEPLTVALGDGTTGTVTGSAIAGPRREFELPLANPQLQFAEADLVTLADWYRTRSSKVAIMDSPTGGTRIGTISKRKTKVFALGHYATGRALVEVDGAIAGYVDMGEIETIDSSDRPQFAAASATRPVYATMTCIGSDFEFDNAEEGADTFRIAECYGPLGEPDFIPVEELGNA